jgi:hypothetical protein
MELQTLRIVAGAGKIVDMPEKIIKLELIIAYEIDNCVNYLLNN